MQKVFSRAESIYYNKLYSPRRFARFVINSWHTAKSMHFGWYESFKVFCDLIWCNFRYGAMDVRDYVWFDFYGKSASRRNEYLTSRRYFKTVKHFDKSTFFRLIDKDNVYDDYSEFIKRDWIKVTSTTASEDVLAFVRKHGVVLVKPVSSEQGRGIFKISFTTPKEIETLIESAGENGYIIEELLSNCRELQTISTSLNTIRVYTLTDKMGGVKITNMFLRVGRKGELVDNWGNGGVGYNIDLETGVIDRPGIDNKGNKFVYHPNTNIKMVGLDIPRFRELYDFAYKIASHNKKVIYAGIDIAILDDRMELVEINFPGGRKGLQVMDDTGRYSLVRKIW